MNRFHWYLFRWLVKRIVKQGGQDEKIRTAYKIMHDEADLHYSEEDWLTIDRFMESRFNEQRCDIGSISDKAKGKGYE